jgi:tripartite-type tricarboxylate transporter receptor subunit TctC
MSAYPPILTVKADILVRQFRAKGRHSGCFWILLLVGKGAQVRGASPVKLTRWQFLHLAAGAAALQVLSRNASAQTYPTRSVRLIVGFPAGNASDTFARLIAQSLSERLGQQFVVENRPGAGGNVGTEVVVRASPDGYTLLLVLTSNAINTTLYANLNSTSSATSRRSRVSSTPLMQWW